LKILIQKKIKRRFTNLNRIYLIILQQAAGFLKFSKQLSHLSFHCRDSFRILLQFRRICGYRGISDGRIFTRREPVATTTGERIYRRCCCHFNAVAHTTMDGQPRCAGRV